MVKKQYNDYICRNCDERFTSSIEYCQLCDKCVRAEMKRRIKAYKSLLSNKKQ